MGSNWGKRFEKYFSHFLKTAGFQILTNEEIGLSEIDIVVTKKPENSNLLFFPDLIEKYENICFEIKTGEEATDLLDFFKDKKRSVKNPRIKALKQLRNNIIKLETKFNTHKLLFFVVIDNSLVKENDNLIKRKVKTVFQIDDSDSIIYLIDAGRASFYLSKFYNLTLFKHSIKFEDIFEKQIMKYNSMDIKNYILNSHSLPIDKIPSSTCLYNIKYKSKSNRNYVIFNIYLDSEHKLDKNSIKELLENAWNNLFIEVFNNSRLNNANLKLFIDLNVHLINNPFDDYTELRKFIYDNNKVILDNLITLKNQINSSITDPTIKKIEFPIGQSPLDTLKIFDYEGPGFGGNLLNSFVPFFYRNLF